MENDFGINHIENETEVQAKPVSIFVHQTEPHIKLTYLKYIDVYNCMYLVNGDVSNLTNYQCST